MPTQIVIAIDDQANRDAWGLRPYGAWGAGAYPQGAVATFAGALWIANAQTDETPGVGDGWSILVPGVVSAEGALFPIGVWNAATNTPTLASGVGTNGYIYRVGTAGTTTLDGKTDWRINDLAIFLDGAWRKIRNDVLVAADISDSTAAGRALLAAADAAAQRTALGLGAAALAALSAFLQPANNLLEVASVPSARSNLAISPGASVRQTVMAGPVDTGGLPTLLPATSGTLSLATQNVDSTHPLIVGAARGANEYGGVDAVSKFTTNQTWSSLPPSATLYLYINAATGALGFTALAPIYQHGGSPATTNGQFTFNISEMKGYLGNGSAAPETPLVFVGECVTNGSGVTSSIAYAYRGIYDSGFTATLPTGAVSKNANLGVAQPLVALIFECTSTDLGYAAGDQIDYSAPGASAEATVWAGVRGNTIGFAIASAATLGVNDKSSGAGGNLTAANWKYKLVARRRW